MNYPFLFILCDSEKFIFFYPAINKFFLNYCVLHYKYFYNDYLFIYVQYYIKKKKNCYIISIIHSTKF